MKIIWSPLSLERIVEIAKYIAEDKPGASNNWVESYKREYKYNTANNIIEYITYDRENENDDWILIENRSLF